MRELIIARLEDLKERENGFSPLGKYRWINFNVEVNGRLKHLSEIEWCELTDEELLKLFERVIKRYNAQM